MSERRSAVAELPDGTRLLIRDIAPGERDTMARAFDGLSPRSRRLRYLTDAAELTEDDLAELTAVDGARHVGVVATDFATGHPLGVARYLRTPTARDRAEVALEVVDEWQGRGVGSTLFAELTDRARRRGVRHYAAVVASDNTIVRSLLHDLGAVLEQRDDDGADRYVLDLTSAQVTGRLARAPRRMRVYDAAA